MHPFPKYLEKGVLGHFGECVRHEGKKHEHDDPWDLPKNADELVRRIVDSGRFISFHEREHHRVYLEVDEKKHRGEPIGP